MKLQDRIRESRPEGRWTEKEVDALLAGTRLMLCALGDDLIENEREARETINCLVDAVAALPADRAAVKDLDRRRQEADAQLLSPS